MEAQLPMFMMIALAVGAGLLAVFVVWLSKFIANEQTRSQGITIAAITVGVLLLGLLGTWSSERPLIGIQDTSTMPPAVPHNGSLNGGATIESAPGIHFHAQHSQQSTAAGRFAWGPLGIGAIVVAVIVVLATSRKGLAAALAGLGIVGAVLVMILYAVPHRRTAEMSEVRIAPPPHGTVVHQSPVHMPSLASPPSPEADHGIDPSTESAGGIVAEAESTSNGSVDSSHADDSSKSNVKAAAEASPTTAIDAQKSPAPAWIDDEPTMEDGVYRAVVVSGPYSTQRECERHLDEPLRNAMMEYAETYLPPNARYQAWADVSYNRNNIIEARHWAQENYSVAGKMHNLYVRLKVEPRDVARYSQLARKAEERQAVEAASLGGFLVFGALVVLYGGLRFVGRKKSAGSADPGGASAEATA